MRNIFTMFYLVIALIDYCQSARAQVAFGAVINGQVKDKADKNLGFATVVLLQGLDSSLVKGTIADANGFYAFENIREGKYLVAASALGMKKAYSQLITIESKEDVVKLAPIVLIPQLKQLQELSVTAHKPFIEQKIDKTVVNVEASVTNVGASALEVLEKSPGVSVDKDGNVSLKGKQGVMILVDGKPTYLSGQDLANMLRNMPSSQLEQIEIMTNPTAKYDAAGNSGIINIRTRKNKQQGFNGSVTLGAGQGYHPKANESINLNYRKGKFNLFGVDSYRYNEGHQELLLLRNFRNSSTKELLSVFRQAASMTPLSQSHQYKAGVDYFASSSTTLGIVFSGYQQPSFFSNTNTTYIEDKNGNLINRTDANNHSSEQWSNEGVNFNLKHGFDSSGTEMTADLDYLEYHSLNDQFFGNYFYDASGIQSQPDELLKGSLPASIKIYSTKVDFTYPLKKHVKIEAGGKTSFVKTDNNAQYFNWVNNQWTTDQGRSNHFIYQENVNALYVNASKQFNPKWNAQIGLRMENTIARGNQLTTQKTFQRNNTQLFPTIYISYVLNKNNQWVINYGKRIERPDYQDMNPFYYFLDKYTYQVGNPYLKPQFSHNIELNHTYKGIFTTVLNFSQTHDIISQVLDQVDSIHTTYVKLDNISKRINIGLSLSGTLPITKWWRASIYAYLYNNRYVGKISGTDYDVSAASFMFNANNLFNFEHGWGAELSGFYRSRDIEGIMVGNPMGMISMGVSKQVLNKRGALKLNVKDIFHLQRFRASSRLNNIDVTIQSWWDNRVANLSFTYRFGKEGIEGGQRRKNSASEEQNRVKQGGQQ